MAIRSMRLALGLLALTVCGQASASQPTASSDATQSARPEPSIRRAEPIFKKMANYEQYGAPGPYYPERAVQVGQQGGAALECVLRSSGALDLCHVLVEKPGNMGFGDASLKMAEKRWMTTTPSVIDGHPVADEMVDVIVPFVLRKR